MRQVLVSFSQVASDKMLGNGLKLYKRRVGLVIRKNLFMKRVVKYQNRLPGEVVESPYLQAFRRHADVALRDMA